MYLEIFGVIAPILTITAVGYALERGGAGLKSETLSTLIMMVGTPALVFSALTSTEIADPVLARMAGAAVLVVLAAALVGAVALGLAGLSLRAFLPSLTMPNSGNIGLPVVFLAFGEDGLAIGVAFFFVIALFQYTVVPFVASGRYSLGALLREPLVYAIAAVVLVKAFKLPVPTFLADTTRILGGMMIPVMVILLGGSLARLRIGDLGVSIGLALLRLCIGVSMGYLVVRALGLSGVEAGALFLLASMPTAIITYVFAARHGREPDRVAGLVVASTLLTFCALPGLLAIALMIRAA